MAIFSAFYENNFRYKLIISKYVTKTNTILNKMYGRKESRYTKYCNCHKSVGTYMKNIVEYLHKTIQKWDFFGKNDSLLRNYMIYYSHN